MASSGLRAPNAGRLMPRVPKVLLNAAVRSSSLLGHDLMNRYRAERYQLFLTGHLTAWAGAGIALPVWEYVWIFRSPWLLLFVAVGSGQCVALIAALRLARLRRYQLSITVVCIATWISCCLVTLVSPPLLPAMVLIAMVPVVFAEPYIRWQRGLAFTIITAVVVLVMAAIARYTHISDAPDLAPRWLETAFVMVAVPFNVLHLMVIVWNIVKLAITAAGSGH